MDGDDVRMIEPSGSARFLVKALLIFVGVLALEADVDRLHRYRTLEHRIERLVHHAHRAAAQFRLDDVAGELCGLHAGAFSARPSPPGRPAPTPDGLPPPARVQAPGPRQALYGTRRGIRARAVRRNG